MSETIAKTSGGENPGSFWGELPPLPESQDTNTGNASGEWAELKDAGMTRDERIADGKEKVDALKSKAKAGLGNMMNGLRDRFYIGVSRSSELPGQIAEKGARAKEFAGNTWIAAREKAADLFDNGRDFISQKAQEARERKAERQQRRLERKEARQIARDERAAERRRSNERAR